MGDDKPFECTVSGCGMKFTNEDHLTVHKTKHQLTLTLLPNDFKTGQTLGFVDQTPTPSKFLKNFEEVTLFHDFAKNPFEEAFKKATEQPSPCTDLESSATASAYDTLNTPNPGFLVAVVENKLSNSSTNHGNAQNSFIHSSEHSFYLMPSPTCQINETTNHNTEWTPMEVDHLGQHHHHHQQQHVETNQSMVVNNVENLLCVGNNSLLHGMMDLNSVTTDTGCITYLLANDTLVPMTIPAISMDEEENDPLVARGNWGKQKPVQIKSSNGRGSVDFRQLIKIRPSPVPTSSSSSPSRIAGRKVPMVTAKSGIAKTTKEKLKAAIQQQQQQQVSTDNYTSDVVDFIGQQNVSPMTSSSSSSSSSSTTTTTTWKTSYVMSNAEAKEIEECEDVVGSLITGKEICLVPLEEEKEDKRRKFLERNRAAAARCRQKKKVWMNSLAMKSELLESSNKNMQNEMKQLRKEVELLRSVLESHKECPVTLKQKALKEEMQSDHVTSSSTSSSVGVVIATSDEELAMSALSNMANYAG